MSDHCNYSLITGKVVASICKVDVSTLSLQATFFWKSGWPTLGAKNSKFGQVTMNIKQG